MPRPPAQGPLWPLAILLLAATLPTAAAQELPSYPEIWFDDLQVTEDQVFEDVVIHVNKTITVHSGATLELRHVEVVFHGKDLVHGLITAGADGERPVSRLIIRSTEKGPTYIHHAPGGDYLFSTTGALQIEGTKEHPVLIEQVRGQSAGANADQFLPLFTDGMQIVGGPNEIDHLFFANTPAGIAIASQGPTRIANLSMTHVGIGLYLHFSNDTLVRDSTVSAARAGLYANGAQNATVIDSRLWGFHYGTLMTNSYARFGGTEFMGGHNAATVYNGGRVEFLDSRFHGYKTAGLVSIREFNVKEAGAPSLLVRRSTFEGNGTGEAGLYAETADEVYAWNNTFSGHNSSGIHILFAGLADLRDNVATRNGHHGIEVVVAPFIESGNRFGDDEADWNGEAGFVGRAPTAFQVVDAEGNPVEGAEVVVTGGPIVEPVRAQTDAAGFVRPLLEQLRIGRSGDRTEHAYEVTATKAGNGTARMSVVPIDPASPERILRLGADAPRPTGPTSIPNAAPLAAVAGAMVLALALRRR